MISDELAKILAPMIALYPLSYATGGDVISYIMLTNGNAHEWVETPEGFVVSDVGHYYPCNNIDKAVVMDDHLRKAKIPTLCASSYYYGYSRYSMCHHSKLPENIHPLWQEALKVAMSIKDEYPDGLEHRLNQAYDNATAIWEQAGDNLQEYYTPIIKELLIKGEYDKARKIAMRCQDTVTRAFLLEAIKFYKIERGIK